MAIAEAPTSPYHAKLRNLFAGGSHAASNSPLAYMEKSSLTGALLLQEQEGSNDQHLKQLKRHEKLLKQIADGTKDSFGIKDMVLGSFLTRFMGGAWSGLGAIIKGGGAAILTRMGLKSIGVKAIAGSLRTSAAALFGGIGSMLRSTFTLAFKKSQMILSAIGKPMTMFFKGLGSLGTTSGTLRALTTSVGKIMPLLKGGGKLLGKLFWPVTAILGLLDAFKGFSNAEKILGNPTGLIKKFQVGITEAVDGLLLGIPSWITRKMGGSSFSSAANWLVDRMVTRATNGLDNVLKLLRLPTTADILKRTGGLQEGILSMGGYLKDSVLGLVADIKGWFGGTFTRLRKALGIDSTFSDKVEAIKERRRVHGKTRNFIDAPTSTNKGSRLSTAPAGAVITAKPVTVVGRMTSAAAANEISGNEEQSRRLLQNSYSQLSPEGRAVIQQGMQSMTALGATMAATQAAGTAVMTDEFKKSIDKPDAATDNGYMAKAAAFYSSITSAMGKEGTRIANELGNATTSVTKYIEDGANTTAGTANEFNKSDFGNKGAKPTSITPDPGITSAKPLAWRTGEEPKVNTLTSKPIPVTTPGGVVTDNKHQKEVMDALLGAGLNKKEAAALAGNFMQESTVNMKPDIKGDNGNSTGIGQFDRHRYGNLQKYAAEHGLDPNSRTTQAKFAVEEGNPNSKYKDYGAVKALSWMRANPNASVDEMTAKYTWDAERPNKSAAHVGKRQEYARGLYNTPDTPGNRPTPEASRAFNLLTNPDSGKGGINLPNVAGTIPEKRGGLKTAGRGNLNGVDPRLLHIMREANAEFPLRTRLVSGRMGRNSGEHAKGNAADFTIYDQNGHALNNYQDSRYFRIHEAFGQLAMEKGKKLYPELFDGKGQDFNWGGYFGDASPGKYKYGSNDAMDFRLTENNKMRAGNLMQGLNKRHAWYAKDDVFGGSKPYDPKVLREDLARMRDFRVSPEQAARDRQRYFGVAKASGNLGPIETTDGVGVKRVKSTVFKGTTTPTHSQFAQANPPSPSLPKLTMPTKAPEFADTVKRQQSAQQQSMKEAATQNHAKAVAEAGLARQQAAAPQPSSTALNSVAPAPKLGDIASMDEMKMLMMNSSIME